MVGGEAGMGVGNRQWEWGWGGKLTGWSDPHVLLTVQHEAAHRLALWTVRCSLAH